MIFNEERDESGFVALILFVGEAKCVWGNRHFFEKTWLDRTPLINQEVIGSVRWLLDVTARWIVTAQCNVQITNTKPHNKWGELISGDSFQSCLVCHDSLQSPIISNARFKILSKYGPKEARINWKLTVQSWFSTASGQTKLIFSKSWTIFSKNKSI